jgi:hypothetical protein
MPWRVETPMSQRQDFVASPQQKRDPLGRTAQSPGYSVTKLGILALAVIALWDSSSPGGLLAQTLSVRSYTVSVGPSFYRLSELGHGTAIAASGSMHWRRKGPLQLQVGLTSWWEMVTIQAGPFTSTETKRGLIPEVGLRLAGSGSIVRPYVAAGTGYLLSLGGLRSGPVLYASMGMDWHLRGRLSIRADARLRSVRPFAGRTLDVFVGIGSGW